jgi:peptidoglycan/LPS O-acetylase OafA/YrhL
MPVEPTSALSIDSGRAPTSLSDKHVVELDGIRGLAIASVMIFHQTVMRPVTGLDYACLRVTSHLNAGVDLFFVLSGFLITGILYDSLRSPHYYRNFYARRCLRIVPLYYIVLFVAFVVLPRFPHPKLAKWGHIQGLGQLWYWLFLSNWSLALGGIGPRHGMVDLSWSLSIEEQFYLTWPLLIRALPRRRLMGVCVLLIAIAAAVRGAMVVAGVSPFWPAFMTPARMDGLAAGAWIALAARGPNGAAWLVSWARRIGSIAAVALLAMIFIPALAGPGECYLTVIGQTFFTLGFASLLILAVEGPRTPWLSAILRSPIMTTFGFYSYALYLFHAPVLAVIRDLVFPPSRFPTLFGSPLPGQLIFYTAASLAVMPFAWLSWRLWERPWLSLKRYVPSHPVAPPHAAEGNTAQSALPPHAIVDAPGVEPEAAPGAQF